MVSARAMTTGVADTALHPLRLSRCWKTTLLGTCRSLFPKRRRFHAFVMGTSKTGTHSLAGMFERFRTLHEPSGNQLHELLIRSERRDLEEIRFRRWLVWRDRAMGLELESNCFLSPFVELVAASFPSAKYVVLFRDPRAWLDSKLNHSINRPHAAGSVWTESNRAQYRPDDYSFGPEEGLFEPLGLFPLRSYLAHWSRINESLLDSLGGLDTLFLPTSEIAFRAAEIAEHVGVQVGDLVMSKAHLFTAPKRHGLLHRIEEGYVRDVIDTICGPTHTRLLGASIADHRCNPFPRADTT